MSMMKVIEGMISVLKSPDSWCKGETLMDEEGHETLSFSEAVRYSLVGAFAQVTFTLGISSSEVERLHRFMRVYVDEWSAAHAINFTGLSSFNNHPETRHSDVMNFLHYVKLKALESEKR